MSRPQQFDRDDVLDRALMVFWLKGFETASIQDLVDATGLNRGSLYNTFGDKAELFAAVMERYRDASPTKPLADAARRAPDGIDSRTLIVAFFKDLTKRALNDPEHKGCLLTNTSAGFYGCADSMAEWVRATLSGLENTLTTLVERGQKQGDITSDAKARAIARSLIASAQGLNVLARSGANAQTLKDVAALAVRVLDR
ncbi:MAG: TetR/AcrR family transcriptional regulator [Rhodospirillales bacterium]|nr:TetR/AcrR family transcriptional regulator [Rhodospirillales bacterium]